MNNASPKQQQQQHINHRNQGERNLINCIHTRSSHILTSLANWSQKPHMIKETNYEKDGQLQAEH